MACAWRTKRYRWNNAIDTPAAVVHSFAMHNTACLTIADRRRRRPLTGVRSLRVR